MTFVLLFLTGFSIYDFIKSLQGKTDEMVLKLPAILQNSIRKNIRMQMKDFRIFGSAVILGFLVSILELLCTGQVYLPTISVWISSDSQRMKGLFYLLIYNLAFILPLTAVFILVLFGVSSKKIGDFFAKHVSLVKLIFVVIFLLFSIIMITIVIQDYLNMLITD